MSTVYNLVVDETSDKLILKQRSAWQTIESSVFLGGTALQSANLPGTNLDYGATFLFNGSAIEIYGLSAPGVPLFVDGVLAATNPNTAYIHDGVLGLVYKSGNLTGYSHNITFPSFIPIVDYFVVTTTDLASFPGARAIVDEQDPVVTYASHGWTNDDNYIEADGWKRQAYHSQFLYTNQGDRSSNTFMSFTFTGVSVSIYGFFPFNDDILYQTPPVFFTLDGDTQPTPNRTDQTRDGNYLWYNRTSLNPTTHTLVIHFDQFETVNTTISPFTLDYILVEPVPPSNANGSPTSTSSIPSVITISSSTPSSTQPSSANSSLRTILIGSIVGGFAAVFIIAALVYFFRRKIFPALYSSHTSKYRPNLLSPTEEYFPRSPLPAAASLVDPFTYAGPHQTILRSVSLSSRPSESASSLSIRPEGSKTRLIAQGGSTDPLEIPLPEKASSSKWAGSHSQYPSVNISTSSSSDRTSTPDSVPTVSQTQRIQGLVSALQQEIHASGIVVTPESYAASPPPYERSTQRRPAS